MKYDLIGLPFSVTRATMWFHNYDREDSSTTTPFYFCFVNGSWTLSMTWSGQPASTCYGPYGPPTPGYWFGLTITSWYNNWKSGVTANHGIMLKPQYTNNNFDMFRPSRYADFVEDPAADGKRPVFQFEFTPTITLKTPLPGNHRWLVTNEVGGYECKGVSPWPDTYHQDVTGNYFSIDFSWRNIADPGAAVYDQDTDNIPILAAAGGKVVEATFNSSNGNYVVIDHDGDGNLNTGFSTRY